MKSYLSLLILSSSGQVSVYNPVAADGSDPMYVTQIYVEVILTE